MHTKTTHQSIIPYFMVRNAGQFLDFAKAVFNAELVCRQTRDDTEEVVHAELTIAGNRLFFADSGQCGGEWISPSTPEGSCASTSSGGKPIQMYILVEDIDETSRKAIAAGGSIIMEPFDDGDGQMCGIADPFENLWWLKSTNQASRMK